MNHRIAYRSILSAVRQVAILAGLMLLSSLPAWGQASQIPNAVQQFVGPTGSPYASGQVFMYVPNTSTPKNTWKDSAQSQLNTNPINLDSAGRAILWGLGTYRQVLKDKNGNQVWDNITVAPPTAATVSTSGAGDFLPIGAILPIAGYTAPVNYLLAYGQPVSRVTYPDALTALTQSSSASCANGNATLSGLSAAVVAQTRVGAPVEASCLSFGTTVASLGTTSITVTPAATATASTTVQIFNWGNGDGSTTFNLPDLRGRVLPGDDAMGGTAANRLHTSLFGQTTSAPGATGGSDSYVLGIPNIPSNLVPFGTISTATGTISTATGTISTATGTISTPTITVNGGANVVNTAAGSNLSGGGTGGTTNVTATSSTPTFTGNAQTFTGNAQTFTGNAQTFTGSVFPGAASTPVTIIMPAAIVNYVVKVLNGTLPTIGVLSLGGMTGDILCGAGLTCSSNTISATGTTSTGPVLFGIPDASTNTGSFFTIQGLTNQPSPNANLDFVPMWDHASGTFKKVTPGVLGSTGLTGVSSFNSRVGAVTLTAADVINAGQLEVLTGNRDYYVRTDGNDSTCNGKTNAAAAAAPNCAFLTIPKAVAISYGTLNWAGFSVTVHVADGTYSAGASVYGQAIGQTGSSVFTILGNTTTPTNVVISSSSADAFTLSNGAVATISGVQVGTPNPGSFNCFTNQNQSIMTLTAIAVGNCGVNGVSTAYQSLTIINNTTIHILGSPGFAFFYTTLSSTLLVASTATTITGSPGWPTAFLVGAVSSYSHFVGSSFSGASTGLRFYMYMNAVYSDGSANGYDFLPGSASGLTMSGAVYNNDYEYNSWTTYNPTITTVSGTSAVASGQYKTHGKDLHINVNVTVTAAGTSGSLSVPLPIQNNYYNLALIGNAAFTRALTCIDTSTGLASGICGASIAAGTSSITISGPAPGGTGGTFTTHTYTVTGTIEIQ